MALFDRRTVIFSLAFCFAILLMLGTTSMIYYHNRLPCDEDFDSRFLSPDGEWTADLMERRCQDSPVVIHVYLHRMEEPIETSDYSGVAARNDIFVLKHDSGDPEPSLEWNTSSQLTIRCPGCLATRVRMRKERWGPITVRYQPSYPDSR